MVDWNAVAITALKELGGDKTLVRGARLRDRIHEIAIRDGESLQDFLESTRNKFGEFLEAVPDVVVHRRTGTDMFVGMKGASWTVAEGEDLSRYEDEGIRLRADVYAAFSMISDRPCYYLPDRDEFTRNVRAEDTGDLLELPQVTLDALIEERREFAKSQTNEDSQRELLKALDYSASPLGQFQAAISQQHLGWPWHQYKASRLMQRLEEWARSHGLSVSKSWIVRQPARDALARPQNLLSRFSSYMTDEEVRAIQIPFRAVEAMYRDLARRRSL